MAKGARVLGYSVADGSGAQVLFFKQIVGYGYALRVVRLQLRVRELSCIFEYQIWNQCIPLKFTSFLMLQYFINPKRD